MVSLRTAFLTLALVGVVSVFLSMGTAAFFTSSATTTGITITSGTAELRLYDPVEDRVVGTLVSAIQHEAIYPGWAFGLEPLVLYNGGTLDLAVTLSASLGDPPGAPGMSDLLYVSIYAWTDVNGDGVPTQSEGTLLFGPGKLKDVVGLIIGRIENDLDGDARLDDAYDPGPEQDFLIGGDDPASSPAPPDAHSGFKGLFFNWESRSSGSDAVDNTFQGKVLTASLIFTATDQTAQEPE